MKHLNLILILVVTAIATAFAQPKAEDPQRRPQAQDAILLTVVLRHDQTRTVDEIQQLQETQGFYRSFPPAGTSVLSWNVAMGIGQIVTLEVPAGKLREVNTAIERTAWKAFRTEFYPTYDLYPVVREKLANKSRVVR